MEILLVCLLMVVLVSLASPRLKSSFENMIFSFALRDVEKAIRYGQYRAVLDGIIYRLSVDRARATYQLQRKRLDKGSEFEVIREGLGRRRLLPRGIQFAPLSDEAFLFFPDGSSTGGTLTLNRGGVPVATLKLSPAYGGFKIERK